VGRDPKDDEDDRKASVIHTRIPESLEAEIRKRAASLGLSVSNLVRNVLLNTFGLVESVIVDGADVARSARALGKPVPPRNDAPPTVLAWQEVTLALNALCDRCNAVLARGERAAIAVTDAPGPRIFRCLVCVVELPHDPNE
jgi:hypothetical protein